VRVLPVTERGAHMADITIDITITVNDVIILAVVLLLSKRKK
jgi:hypothetical protein